ncbi:hypothetical protein R3P38DRAFT_2835972, partial [Favolaschia claudopus]
MDFETGLAILNLLFRDSLNLPVFLFIWVHNGGDLVLALVPAGSMFCLFLTGTRLRYCSACDLFFCGLSWCFF